MESTRISDAGELIIGGDARDLVRLAFVVRKSIDRLGSEIPWVP